MSQKLWIRAMKRRDRLMVIADIIQNCEEWVPPTRILGICSIQQYQIDELMPHLIKHGLMEKKDVTGDNRGKYKYRATGRGLAFVRTLDKWYQYIGLKRMTPNEVNKLARATGG